MACFVSSPLAIVASSSHAYPKCIPNGAWRTDVPSCLVDRPPKPPRQCHHSLETSGSSAWNNQMHTPKHTDDALSQPMHAPKPSAHCMHCAHRCQPTPWDPMFFKLTCKVSQMSSHTRGDAQANDADFSCNGWRLAPLRPWQQKHSRRGNTSSQNPMHAQ